MRILRYGGTPGAFTDVTEWSGIRITGPRSQGQLTPRYPAQAVKTNIPSQWGLCHFPLDCYSRLRRGKPPNVSRSCPRSPCFLPLATCPVNLEIVNLKIVVFKIYLHVLALPTGHALYSSLSSRAAPHFSAPQVPSPVRASSAVRPPTPQTFAKALRPG